MVLQTRKGPREERLCAAVRPVSIFRKSSVVIVGGRMGARRHKRSRTAQKINASDSCARTHRPAFDVQGKMQDSFSLGNATALYYISISINN